MHFANNMHFADLIQWEDVDTKTEECPRYSNRKTILVSDDNNVVEQTNGKPAGNISRNDGIWKYSAFTISNGNDE